MKLSVLVITFNHGEYIAQALDSVLIQEVDFDYEIVVGEDCSTDNTRQILIEYQRKYPEKIRLLLPESNLGMINNFIATFKSCKGEYVALLEGDDYWTCPDKLQSQVDFLDAHPGCSVCFHNCEEFYEDGSKPSWNYCTKEQKEISTLEDLIVECNFIPTCSAVFRNKLFPEFPDWYFTLGMGDWTLHILNAQHGDIGYIDKVMARHRHHGGGVWSLRSQAKNILDVIRAYEVVDRYLNYQYKPIIRGKISAYYYQLAHIYGNDSLITGLKYLFESFYKSTNKLNMAPKLLTSPFRMITGRMKRVISGN
jgi:glycosyltransferase involved in cell wall biosynthesis